MSRDVDGAIGDATAAVERGSEPIVLHSAFLTRAIAKRHKMDLPGALEDLNNAIQHAGPGDGDTYVERGKISCQQGDFIAAAKDEGAALKIGVRSMRQHEAYLWKALAELELGNRETSVADLEKAIAAYSGAASDELHQAWRLYRDGRVIDASKAVDQAVVKDIALKPLTRLIGSGQLTR